MRHFGIVGVGFKNSIGAAIALVLASAGIPSAQIHAQSEESPRGEWISLFNGKNLEGWTPKIRGQAFGEDSYGTFRVEDGVIKVSYGKYSKFDEQFGHLFYKSKFSNYRLRVEYRFVGEQCPGGPGWATRNSGVMLHCQDPRSMKKDQDFPVSIEVQFLGGLGRGKRSTANVCSPGTNIEINGKLITRHVNESSAKTYDGDQWVKVEVEVHGDQTIRHIVEGKTVLEYAHPQLDPKDANAASLIKNGELALRDGYISLQSESHPIEFRKVEIMLLDR